MEDLLRKILGLFPRIVIDFNKEWELNNWYVACTKKPDYGLRGGDDLWYRDLPPEAIKIAKEAKNIEDGTRSLQPIFEDFLKRLESQHILETSIKGVERDWKPRAKDFFLALSKMLEVHLSKFEKEYKAHFTFTRRCPFYRNEFMFSQFGFFPNTATHEIMHIEFLKAYEAYCKTKGLTDSEVQHLKEILTVLLDEEEVIKKIRSHRDYGYTKHEKIRDKVATLYHVHKMNHTHFKDFLDSVIPLVKEAGF